MPGATAERRGDQPAAIDDQRAAAAAPRAARLTLHVTQRLPHRRLVRGAQRADELGLTDTEKHAHALGRTERQIKPGHRARRERSPQLSARPGVTPVEQQTDSPFGDLAAQRQRRRTAPHPRPGSLTLAGVVVPAALRDLLDVVAPRRWP